MLSVGRESSHSKWQIHNSNKFKFKTHKKIVYWQNVGIVPTGPSCSDNAVGNLCPASHDSAILCAGFPLRKLCPQKARWPPSNRLASPAESQYLFLRSSKRSPIMSLIALALSYAQPGTNLKEMKYADWLVWNDQPIWAAGEIHPHLNDKHWAWGNGTFSEDQILLIAKREKGIASRHHNFLPSKKVSTFFFFLTREDLVHPF